MKFQIIKNRSLLFLQLINQIFNCIKIFKIISSFLKILNLKINNFRIFGTIKNSKHTIFVCLEKNNKIKAFTLKLKNYFYIFLHIFTYFYKICKVRFKGILNYINGLLCLL